MTGRRAQTTHPVLLAETSNASLGRIFKDRDHMPGQHWTISATIGVAIVEGSYWPQSNRMQYKYSFLLQ